MRNVYEDIRAYKHYPNVVRTHWANNEYSSPHCAIAVKWLESKKRQEDIEDFFDDFSGVVVGLSLLVSVAVPIVQVGLWLKSGNWTEAPLSIVLRWLEIDLSFLVAPTDWVGFFAVLSFILDVHLSIALPLLALCASSLLNGLVTGANIILNRRFN